MRFTRETVARLEAAFGALRAGLIVVNTNPLYTAREMEHQFKDSGAKAIVILANSAHYLEAVIDKTDIKTVIVTQVGDRLGFPKSLLVNGVVKYVKKMVPPFSLPGAYAFNQALELGADHEKVPKNFDFAAVKPGGCSADLPSQTSCGASEQPVTGPEAPRPNGAALPRRAN